MDSQQTDAINFTHIHDAFTRISNGERATTPTLYVPTLLRFWLWGSDANEKCDNSKCEFHQMHLAGMLCTKVFEEAFQNFPDTGTTPVIVDNDDVHHIILMCDVFIPHFYQTSDSAPQTTTDKKTPAPVCVPNRVTLQEQGMEQLLKHL